MASNGERPEMLFNFLKITDQPPNDRLAPNVSNAKVALLLIWLILDLLEEILELSEHGSHEHSLPFSASFLRFLWCHWELEPLFHFLCLFPSNGLVLAQWPEEVCFPTTLPSSRPSVASSPRGGCNWAFSWEPCRGSSCSCWEPSWDGVFQI